MKKIRINDTLDDILFHEEGSCKQILDTLFININRMDTGMIYIAISLITAALLWVAGILLFALLTKIFQSAKTGLIIKIFNKYMQLDTLMMNKKGLWVF